MKNKNHCRRIVTAEREDGTSFLLSDGKATDSYGVPGILEITDLWESSVTPAHLPVRNEYQKTEHTGLLPVLNGTKLVYEVISPASTMLDEEITERLFAATKTKDTLILDGSRSVPGMHNTHTLDYVIILTGEIYLILDEQEVLVKAGDVVIQGGVVHTWENRSEEPCTLIAVLVGGKYS